MKYEVRRLQSDAYSAATLCIAQTEVFARRHGPQIVP